MSQTASGVAVQEQNNLDAGLLPMAVDYGVRARASLAGAVEEGDPLIATPELSAMLELLANDGHSIDGALDELNRLKGTLATHLTMHRQLARQLASVDSTHAAVLSHRR
jgi:hypothetical protein